MDVAEIRRVGRGLDGYLVFCFRSELENRPVWVTPMRNPNGGRFNAEKAEEFQRPRRVS